MNCLFAAYNSITFWNLISGAKKLEKIIFTYYAALYAVKILFETILRKIIKAAENYGNKILRANANAKKIAQIYQFNI